MAVTRLERKERKLKSRATKRRQALKNLTSKPTIKMVDVEKIKEEFEKKAKASSSSKPAAKELKAEEKTDKKAEAKDTSSEKE